MDSTFSFAANANVSALLIETAMCGSGTKLEEQMTAEDFFFCVQAKSQVCAYGKGNHPESVYVRKKRKWSKPRKALETG